VEVFGGSLGAFLWRGGGAGGGKKEPAAPRGASGIPQQGGSEGRGQGKGGGTERGMEESLKSRKNTPAANGSGNLERGTQK